MSNDEASIESEIQQKGLNAPRLTPQMIDAVIAEEHYLNAFDAVSRTVGDLVSYDDRLKVLTICILVLKNGFIVTGESACASPENYDAEIGRKIARDNARGKIWSLEGYCLRQRLYESEFISKCKLGSLIGRVVEASESDANLVDPENVRMFDAAIEAGKATLASREQMIDAEPRP